jgi:hypothetical protein
MSKKLGISISALQERFGYDPETGVVFFKNDVRSGRENRMLIARAGDRAGYVAPIGYRYVSFQKVRLLEHHVVWALMTGDWPRKQLDHINRQKADNRWENLRECNGVENAANTAKSSRNTSGFKGVSYFKPAKLWAAQIMYNGQKSHLGYYRTPEAAYEAYKAEHSKIHGEFSCVE